MVLSVTVVVLSVTVVMNNGCGVRCWKGVRKRSSNRCKWQGERCGVELFDDLPGCEADCLVPVERDSKQQTDRQTDRETDSRRAESKEQTKPADR